MGLLICAAPAMAQYNATILNDTTRNQAFASYGGNVGGQVDFKAGAWDSSGTFTSMHPLAGWAGSQVNGIWGNQYVGEGQRNGDPGFSRRALLWNGMNTSPSDLTPGDKAHAGLYATDGVNQVGYAGSTVGTPRAYAWSGTVDSAISLAPPGPINWADSFALDVENGQAVGWATKPGGTGTEAFFWSSLNSASAIRLQPNFVHSSYASVIDGGFQYGGVQVAVPGPWHAARWSGVENSYVDIHPNGYFSSLVEAGNDGVVVGGAVTLVGNRNHAMAWIGSGFLDLHTFLPAGYLDSYATGIDHITGDIVGWAVVDGAFPTEHAVRWSLNPVPEPATLVAVGLGLASLLRRRRQRSL